MLKEDSAVAKIIPATRILQTLAQYGIVRKESVDKAELIIKEERKKHNDDINEFIESHLSEIKNIINKINKKNNSDEAINHISCSIANFRANVSMLSDNNYFDICSTILSWIESVLTIDEDFLEILNGYYVSINAIFNASNLSSEQVKFITLEMEEACQRYFDKHLELEITRNIDNSKTLYISNTHLGFDLEEVCSFENNDNLETR